jgi:MFS family permease
MRFSLTGLWRHPNFVKFWLSETISLFGSQITLLALPLTAALTLQATPTQMGILGAAQFAPFLLVSLFAGVYVDRMRRRPILMWANLGRAALLGLIPLSALLGMLGIELLYIIGFLTGVLTVFFDIAYQAFLPSVVQRDQLVEGNSKLEVSRSVAQVTGPGIAGALVEFLTAPLTILFDSISFLVSAFFLGLLRTTEEAPAKDTQTRNVWGEIRAGLGVVFGSPLLRSIAAATATNNFFSNLWGAVFLLYVTRELGIEPVVIGFIFAVGSIGALLGSMLPRWAAQRFGLGPAIVWSQFLGGTASLLIPLASGSLAVAVPLLMLASFLMALGNPIYNVNQLSLRQAITPDRLLGRMNASMRFIVWGTIPIGALIGGLLGEWIGLRQTLIVGVAGMALAFLWVFFSPVRKLREQPRSAED